jgi:hypothetical protein
MRNRVFAVVLGLGVALLAGCRGSPGDTDPSGAAVVTSVTTAEDVVRSYLGALQRHDRFGAESLTTEPYASGDVWAADPPRIEDVEVSAAIVQSTTGTAGEGHAEAVSVPVTFDLHGADETMRDGLTRWSYVLVRDSSSQPWRIASAGVG